MNIIADHCERASGVPGLAVVCLVACWTAAAPLWGNDDWQPSHAPGIETRAGFEVDLVYDVPYQEQGSWVALTADDRGRLIAADQHGGLYRIDLRERGDRQLPVERLAVAVQNAQGLLYALDSLWVVVNANSSAEYPSGLYRLRDTNGNEQFDQVESVLPLEGHGEHGPHAVVLAPDGESLFLVAGNYTKLPAALTASRVPRVWDEDYLLPRLWTPGGHGHNIFAPGGWVCRIRPADRSCELVAVGYRNAYDLAIDRHGELFTFDSDNERDVGAPWYRPIRLCHVVSGGENGWRSGSAKWPNHYPDAIPPVAELGTGSPTGITFAYDTQFSVPYRDALFLLDWSQGQILAAHLEAAGSGYRARCEPVVRGQPLAVTDITAAGDGTLYFAVGGRKTRSSLYRLRQAAGDALPTQGIPRTPAATLRRRLEALHRDDWWEPGDAQRTALRLAWSHLGHADRGVRFAARVAVEHLDVEHWRDRALAETHVHAAVPALLALARCGDAQDRTDVMTALGRFELATLEDRLADDVLRVYSVALARLEALPEPLRQELVERFRAVYPMRRYRGDRELSRLLVFLGAKQIVEETLALLEAAPSQQEQIHFALALRVGGPDWSLAQRERYFRWFQRARSFEGGQGVVNNPEKSRVIFRRYLQYIRDEALAAVPDADRARLAPITEEPQRSRPVTIREPEGPPREWTLAAASEHVQDALRKRDYDRGRNLFYAARCADCHRLGGEGESLGPDLTTLASRFSYRDLLVSILEPNRTISDQYRSTAIETVGGRVITGMIVGQTADTILVVSDARHPDEPLSLERSEIVRLTPASASLMPADLIDRLNPEELRDLVAYLMSRGDPEDRAFH